MASHGVARARLRLLVGHVGHRTSAHVGLSARAATATAIAAPTATTYAAKKGCGLDTHLDGTGEIVTCPSQLRADFATPPG
jgi:hypothetical protein